jgi:hypothetical protein
MNCTSQRFGQAVGQLVVGPYLDDFDDPLLCELCGVEVLSMPPADP